MKPLVLFVDDEQNILNALRRSLFEESYDAFFAASAREALDILKHKNVHVIVSDLNMPEMDGLSLLEEVKRLYPQVIRIILTAGLGLDTILSAINKGEIFRYIIKPFKLDSELKPAIKQAIELYKLQEEKKQLLLELEKKNEELEHIVEKRTRALVAAKEAAERNLRIRTNFMNNVSHEINTPLTTILSSIDLVSTKKVPDDCKVFLRLIKDSSERIANLFSSFMELSILKTETLQLVKGPFWLDHIVKEVEAYLVCRLKDSKINFISTCPQTSYKLLGDTVHIKKMLTYLLDNAVKFTESGHIEFNVVLEPVQRSDTIKVQFLISNTSSPIPQNTIDLIFEEFVQGDGSTTRKYGGTGIGLSIANYFAKLMGGDISYRFDGTKGNIFTVTVMLKKERFPEK